MAVRGWGASLATAIGVAAGAGAAQLGLGYGLGVVAWFPSSDAAGETGWVASLTWSVWIAATSTVVGAICATRLGTAGSESADARDPGPGLAPLLWRAALAAAGAIGSLVTVVLVAVPARTAAQADILSPQATAAGYAVVGVMTGVLAAFWAISSPAVARNVLGTLALIWVLAIAAVVDDVVSGGGPAATPLGVWQPTSTASRFWFRDYLYWPGAVLAFGSALVIGALAARPVARRPATRVGAAVSGMAGPLLVTIGYVAVTPRLADLPAEQVSAYLVAPYTVIAGVAGSALVTAVAQRSWTLAQRSAAAGPPTRTAVGEIAAPAPAPGAPGVEVPSPRRGGGLPTGGHRSPAAGPPTERDGTTDPAGTHTVPTVGGTGRAESPGDGTSTGDTSTGGASAGNTPAGDASADGGTGSAGIGDAGSAEMPGAPGSDISADSDNSARSDTSADPARSKGLRGRLGRRPR